MHISVVVPVYNGARTLAECLEAIYASNYTDYDVIVVDDASTDESRTIAESYPCRIMGQSVNRGAAWAKNEGALAAYGEIIFFTDADVIIQPDTLRIVSEDFQDDALIGVVGLLGDRLRYANFCSQFKNLWMHYTYRRQPKYVGLFFTSVASIRRKRFLAMGGFDERYQGASVTEDIEFGQRLLTDDCQVLLDQRLTVEHVKHYGFWDLLRCDLERSRGLFMTFLRNKLGRTERKHWASVPWFFALGVPLSGLIVLFALLALASWQAVWLIPTLVVYAMLVALNWPFLGFMGKLRGKRFLLRSCLFLPLNLFVSGLGILWAVVDYVRGQRY